MGSTFTAREKTIPGKSIFGQSSTDQFYLQFVPGLVLDIVTSVDSAAYTGIRDINSIIAKPHIGGDINHDSVTKTRYYPLLRGIVDVPAKGDPILLCTIGSVNYYLGPLNTMNNPNWNIDHLDIPDINLSKNKSSKSSLKSKLNISKNFSIIESSRLQKIPNIDLDGNQKSLNDISGDIIYEGRYGNSIRIGSRDVNPYIIISNGRDPQNIIESNNDGTILALLNSGTIRQHFKFDSRLDGNESVENSFLLAGDSIEEPRRLIGANDYNYEYSDDQFLLNSKKITFNAKTENITLSSFSNTILGAGNEIKLISNNSTTIESSNIYLGGHAKEKKEPLVLGEQLRLVLEEMLNVIDGLKMTGCVAGLSGPIDPISIQKLTTLKNKLSKPKFWSEYHFIEDNGQKA
jgi:hypothetical protein